LLRFEASLAKIIALEGDTRVRSRSRPGTRGSTSAGSAAEDDDGRGIPDVEEDDDDLPGNRHRTLQLDGANDSRAHSVGGSDVIITEIAELKIVSPNSSPRKSPRKKTATSRASMASNITTATTSTSGRGGKTRERRKKVVEKVEGDEAAEEEQEGDVDDDL